MTTGAEEQHRRDWLAVEQVRQALANPAVASHNAETLAAALHMSTRSLHHPLQEEGLLLRTGKLIKQVAEVSRFE